MCEGSSSDFGIPSFPPSLPPPSIFLPVFLFPHEIDQRRRSQHVKDSLNRMRSVGEGPQLPRQGRVDVIEGEGTAGLQEAEDLREGGREGGR